MRGRTTLLRHREGISLHVRTWLVNSALDSVERRMNCTDNNHAAGLWISLLDASWYRVDSRLVTIDGLGMLLMFLSSLCFQLLWLVEDSAAVTLRYVLTRDWMTVFVFFSYFCCSSCCLPCHLMVDTCALMDIRTSPAIDRSRRHHTLQFTYMSHRS